MGTLLRLRTNVPGDTEVQAVAELQDAEAVVYVAEEFTLLEEFAG